MRYESLTTDRAARRAGFRDGAALPAPVLGASFIGFGALVQEVELSYGHALISTLATWALPGQIVTLEMFIVGAPTLALAAAVALVNARLLPMMMSMAPQVREPGVPLWRTFVLAHTVALTVWAQGLKVFPRLEKPLRLAYTTGFSAALMLFGTLGTLVGYFLAAELPAPVRHGLVYLNIVYFTLIFAGEVRARGPIAALAAGAVLGPACHLLTPQWGILLAGLGGGTLGYLVRNRHPTTVVPEDAVPITRPVHRSDPNEGPR